MASRVQVSVRLLDGEHWLPGSRGNFLDGVEDDAVWVDRNTARLRIPVSEVERCVPRGAYLDEVKASTGDAPHQCLQGDPAIIAIDRNFISQSWITGPLIIDDRLH